MKILYLTRTGLLEPLGQSQVFSYLRGLSADYTITLITYEKAADMADAGAMARAMEQCESFGIRWLPRRFRSHPRFLASALSMLDMALLAWREVRQGEARLIHARSYIPAAVALLVHRLTGVPFVFDMRALWPEELITARRLRRDSLAHKAITWAERACLREAAGVVSLTQAAVEYLQQTYPDELAGQKMIVIPTCADLQRFKPSERHESQARVHGCIGTVLSGWFRMDWLASWVRVALRGNTSSRFDIVTLDDQKEIRRQIDPEGEYGDRLSIRACPSEQMPGVLHGHSLSVMFFADGLSKLGSSPTRMAEVLGSGLPVVVSAGIGDVAQIVAEYRVGVVVSDNSEEEMHRAYGELEDLLLEADLTERCRRVAELVFSLELGVKSYRTLYQSVLGDPLN